MNTVELAPQPDGAEVRPELADAVQGVGGRAVPGAPVDRLTVTLS